MAREILLNGYACKEPQNFEHDPKLLRDQGADGRKADSLCCAPSNMLS